jgi:hypothetical protein
MGYAPLGLEAGFIVVCSKFLAEENRKTRFVIFARV